jgi:hypothetical protein
MRNLLITYDWNFKKFTSEERLWQLAFVGAISVQHVPRNQYGQDFSYYTLDGKFIASYYKDDTFGHGSQPTGIELKHAIPHIELPDTAEFTRYGEIKRKVAC